MGSMAASRPPSRATARVRPYHDTDRVRQLVVMVGAYPCGRPIGVKLRKEEFSMRSGISNGVFLVDRQSNIPAVWRRKIRVYVLARPIHRLPHPFLT